MRVFSAHETTWLQTLDGIELAAFWPRAFAFLIDWMIISVVISIVASLAGTAYFAREHAHGRPVPAVSQLLTEQDATHPQVSSEAPDQIEALAEELHESETVHIVFGLIIPVLYFGTLLWSGKGRTPGKRLMKIRVVSIVHPHLTFWHSVERALGYGAAALELGFGFVQFFIHPYRRCAQDRLAETIVVSERSYQSMRHHFEHPATPSLD